MVAQGYHPVTHVLKQEVTPSSPKVAANLGIEAGTPVIEIVRLRFVEDTPIVLVASYLPHALCPELVNDDLSNQSLYDVLEKKHQLYIARGRRVMQAVPASENEAHLLQVDKGVPLFLLDSISYLEDDTPVEYYYAYHRGDRSQFEVELIRLREADGEAQFESLPPSNKIATS
jgi:GntR family transcriptional regulator